MSSTKTNSADIKAPCLDLGEGAKGVVFATVADAILPKGVNAIVTPRQTHTTNVAVATSPDQSFPDTDALITRRTDIAVGVRTADCVPILLHAPDIKAVAAVHAGWKGTAGRIVEKTINKLIELGADPGNINAAMGPCICHECYTVGEDLAEMFINLGFGACVTNQGYDHKTGQIIEDGMPRLDLPLANYMMINNCGVPFENIRKPTICTFHSRNHEYPPICQIPADHANGFAYPSWRRTPGTTTRLLTIAYLQSV